MHFGIRKAYIAKYKLYRQIYKYRLWPCTQHQGWHKKGKPIFPLWCSDNTWANTLTHANYVIGIATWYEQCADNGLWYVLGGAWNKGHLYEIHGK